MSIVLMLFNERVIQCWDNRTDVETATRICTRKCKRFMQYVVRTQKNCRNKSILIVRSHVKVDFRCITDYDEKLLNVLPTV